MIVLRVLLLIILSFSLASAEETDKWEGYLEFTGKPGTTRSLGVSDLFVPLAQDENDMTFLNVRGHLGFDSDEKEMNIGIGHRHMFSDFILGAYTYYDRSKSDLGFSYNQWTTGMEILGEKWDVRANGYVSDKKTNQWEELGNSTAKAKISGNQIWVDYTQDVSTYKEGSQSGVDGEVGYKLPFLDDLRVYAGGYHFFGREGFKSISGPRARMEMRLHDIDVLGNGSRLMLGLETQYDKPRGSQTSGLLSIRIPFGIESKEQPKRLEGLDRRMMEPVVRDIDIVAGENQTTETRAERTAALNPEDLAYTTVMNHTTEKTLREIGDATKIAIFDGELPLVVIAASEADNDLEVDATRLSGSATYAMAGKSLEVGYRNEYTKIITKTAFTPAGETPNQVYVMGNKDRALWLKDKGHINGWDIDATGFKRGIDLDTAGTFFVTNTTINFASQYGIAVNGEKGPTILYISDSEIEWTGGDPEYDPEIIAGLYARKGGQIFADNVNISESDGMGVLAKYEGSYIEIKNSRVMENDLDGLFANLEGRIFASNMTIENNRTGVQSGYEGNPYIYIEDSVIRGNGVGLSAESGGNIDGHRLTITENDIGVTVFGDPKSIINIYDSVISHNTDFGLFAGAYVGSVINVYGSAFEGNVEGIAEALGQQITENGDSLGAIAIYDSVFNGFRDIDAEFVVEDGATIELFNNVDQDGNKIFFP